MSYKSTHILAIFVVTLNFFLLFFFGLISTRADNLRTMNNWIHAKRIHIDTQKIFHQRQQRRAVKIKIRIDGQCVWRNRTAKVVSNWIHNRTICNKCVPFRANMMPWMRTWNPSKHKLHRARVVGVCPCDNCVHCSLSTTVFSKRNFGRARVGTELIACYFQKILRDHANSRILLSWIHSS